MSSTRSRILRRVTVTLLTLPLSAAGPCLTITTESLIGGFFKAATPVLVEQLKDHLGVPDPPPVGSS